MSANMPSEESDFLFYGKSPDQLIPNDLLKAAAEGNFEKFKELIPTVDIRVVNLKQRNCLHLVCMRLATVFIDYLLAKEDLCKDLINQIDSDGNTPLVLFIRMLLKVNEIFTKKANTAIVELSLPKKMIKILENFIVRGAKVTIVNKSKYNLLHYLCLKGDEEVVEWLLNGSLISQADKCKLINEKNNEGETCLHIAVQKKQIKIVNILLEQEFCDLNLFNLRGQTALHLAALADSSVDILRALLKHKNIKKNPVDNFGQTPLHYAVGSGVLDRVTTLIGGGVDLAIKDQDEYTPFGFAVSDDQYKAVNYFLTNKEKTGLTIADVEAGLLIALKKHAFEVMTSLLKFYGEDLTLLRISFLTKLLQPLTVVKPNQKEVLKSERTRIALLINLQLESFKKLPALVKSGSKHDFHSTKNQSNFVTVFQGFFSKTLSAIRDLFNEKYVFENNENLYVWDMLINISTFFARLTKPQQHILISLDSNVERVLVKAEYLKMEIPLELKTSILGLAYYSTTEVIKEQPAINFNINLNA